ncbi:hypothetical protein RIF29_17081 [Crotalaria pallida]|uniref:VAN3-binding protein-like auxin canalisation domain-containing protein n=1 Tax=Crotalaria pallida TaxID=3830 RepID=A0AAN9FGN7_CROPI
MSAMLLETCRRNQPPVYRPNNNLATINTHLRAAHDVADGGRGKTIERWLKDKKEKKKEQTKAHNAKLHAAVSVASREEAKSDRRWHWR